MITEKDIKQLFKSQLDAISNETLRQGVIDAWVEGCRMGGWKSVDELHEIPFTLLTETHGVNFIEHTIAVTEGAAALAKAQIDTYNKLPYAIDMDRLYAGGLLHDVGKLMEIERDGKGGYRKSLSGKMARHPISGALLAQKCGLPDDIINTIACHAKEGDGRPQVIETVLIHQADFATFDPLVMKQKGILIEL
ncbi:HDIG domain-containing protein [bacterium]|nr:HDIG domain-containing protein [bacterium]